MTKEEAIEQYDAMKQAYQQESAQAVKHAFQAGCLMTLPERYRYEQLSALTVHHPAQAPILRILSRYVTTFSARLKEGTCLFFVGGVGTGKTSTSCAVIQALVQQGYDCCYSTCSHVTQQLNYGLPTHRQVALAKFTAPDFLVIDETPMDDFDAKARRVLFSVVDARYQARRCTAVVSNLGMTSLDDVLGKRIMDRLRHHHVVLGFNWHSLRHET